MQNCKIAKNYLFLYKLVVYVFVIGHYYCDNVIVRDTWRAINQIKQLILYVNIYNNTKTYNYNGDENFDVRKTIIVIIIIILYNEIKSTSHGRCAATINMILPYNLFNVGVLDGR